MIDELVEVLGKSGPHIVWRPGTNGEWVGAAMCGGLPFEVPYQDVKRWSPAGDKSPRALPKRIWRHEMTMSKEHPILDLDAIRG